ncbi:MAG: after-VIT domain-containing protein [Pseudanabaena sp.]|jgi:hypothetical protein
MRYSHSESNTLSRRYELPTCLLEVWTERSPLSDWQSQIVAQNLRFRLQLAHSKKVIKGNQQQITNLIEGVTTYCDRWLAQDDFETLDHAIAVPKLPKLQLSTIQLFDLYESLELCSNEFVILPNLVLEVRRLHPNWLKIVAGAIAIAGVSIGTIRLVSSPFGEQPSYQIASTPAAIDPEKVSIIPSAPPAATSQDQAASPLKPDLNPSQSAASPNPAASHPSQSPQAINRDRHNLERSEKVAIAPEPSVSSNISKSSNRQPMEDNLGSIVGKTEASPSEPPRRLEPPNIDTLSQPAPITTEAAKQAPSAPPTKLTSPATTATTDYENKVVVTNIKVLQIQSELPSDITASLVSYIQTQQITISATGTITFNLEISGDRISSIATDRQGSLLKDTKAIAELEKLILEWRSPTPINGKLRMVLQLL